MTQAPPARQGRLRSFVRRAVVPYGAPLVRAYMQNPIHWGKRPFWQAIGQRFYWQDLDFTARTAFGAKVQGNTRDMIQALIYYFGVWEPYLTDFIQARLRPGDVFVDVGANIGYYALCASRAVGPTGKVVAFEASPGTYGRLLANLALNDADNVRAVQRAVAAAKGKLELYSGPDRNCGMATTVPLGDGPKVLECEVEADTLAALLTADEVRRARVVKIDVEGGEWAVAQGMLPILASCRDDLEIVMEVTPESLAKVGHSATELLDLFRGLGFHAYALQNRYDPFSYIPPLPASPILRIDEVTAQTDVVFSRVDHPELRA